mmetsp:Transcript_54133/g.162058  ORF Transcript_54133/g.162058 Transcript_54133/m.162058 type:complete len:226 (-) Transcript_54133:557-1234(-)
MTDHDAQDATDTSDGSPMKSSQRRSSTTRRRSSLLQRARMSFYRSKGERGADVATLRGTRGADFEGEARVIRGTSDAVLCSCFGGGGNGEPVRKGCFVAFSCLGLVFLIFLIEARFSFGLGLLSTNGLCDQKKSRFMLIKGSSCFVFASEESTSPKYAIKLAFMKAEVHGTTVELQTTLGDVEFRFAFDKAEIAERFAGVVTEQASIAEGDVAKKVRELGPNDNL